MGNEVSNAKAWDVGYNAGIDRMEAVLLKVLSSRNPNATLRELKRTARPVVNPYE